MGKYFPYLILIPLSLSALVHVWNPAGFPDIHGDEGHYIRRAINIMMGGAAEEPEVPEPNRHYGNPFFGQIFLSSVMTLTNYPNSLHLDNQITADSVGHLFFVPRLVMGVLALIDTFIIYKIAERRYNTSTALAASILFAVMPFSWIIRRVLLESIQLPFILSSVMFAVYYNKHSSSMNRTISNKFNIGEIITILVSGIFLGLAIFTKIPSFNMIPLIGLLIFSNNRHKGFRALGLWLIPVILIPSIWPVYAILQGEADKWIEGIFWQTNREGTGILSVGGLLKVDPLLLVLGIGGSIYALIKRDIFCILWIIPFLIFFSVIGLVRTHNFIPLLPLFCLAGGILIADTYKLFRINKMSASTQRILVTGSIIGVIAAFGLLSANLYIPNNVNSTYFELYSFVIRKLPVFSEEGENVNITNKVTVIGSNWVVSSFSWIPNTLYGNDHEFRTIDSKSKIKTEKVLLVIDNRMKHSLSDRTEQAKRFQGHQPQLKTLYDTTHTIAKFNITASQVFRDTASGIIEIKSNY